MRRGRAYGALLGAAAVLLAATACGGGGADGAGGDALAIGVPNPPTSLDPALGTAGGDYPTLYMIYDRLFVNDPKTGDARPELVASWKYLDKARKRLRLTLRQGVRFQDGTPLDADAVAASLKRYQDKGVATDLADVTSVRAHGTSQVVLSMTHPNSALPSVLADRAGMIVSPTAVRKYGKDFAAHPVGAGPYGFQSQVSGSQVTLTRFDQYWRGKPRLSRVDWKISSNPTTLENSVRSGEVQIALRFPPKDALVLKKDRSLTVSDDPSLAFMNIYFNPKLRPVNSAAARQAINYAINRKRLLEVVNGGLGQVSDGPFPKGYPFTDPSAGALWPYDPAKARGLLKEAGVAPGTSMTCLNSHGQGYDAAASLIVADLKAVGINVEVRNVSLAQQHLEFRDRKSAPCEFSSWTGRGDPLMTLRELYHSKGTYNPSHTDYGLDAAIDKLRSTFDPKARIAVTRAIVRDLGRAAPGTPLVTQPAMVARKDTVRGFVPNIVGKPDLRGVYLSGGGR